MMSMRMKLASAIAAVAIVGSAIPVAAQSGNDSRHGRPHDHREGASAGDIIAGAVIVGGLAALIAGAGRDRDREPHDFDDDYRPDGDWGTRRAVNACVDAAEREARSYGRRPDVRRISDVEYHRRSIIVFGDVHVERGQNWRPDRYEDLTFRCQFRDDRVRQINVYR